MANRPQDYGSKFPSDANDPVPPNPTAGFVTTDSKAVDPNLKPNRKQERQYYDPDLGQEQSYPRIRDVFYGIIIQDLNSPSAPYLYKVVLQTGKIITAKCFSKILGKVWTHEFCTIIRGRHVGEYVIMPQYHGNTPPEINLRFAQADNPEELTEATAVKYSITEFETEGDFTYDPTTGELTVNRTGTYEISYSQMFENDTHYWGTLQTSLAYNGDCTVRVNSSDVNNNKVLTGVLPPPLLKTGSITVGKLVYIRYRVDQQNWQVIESECG